MTITVKNPFKVAEAERLMEEQPTLSYFFEQVAGNVWELTREGEEEKALSEVKRYFQNINYTVE